MKKLVCLLAILFLQTASLGNPIPKIQHSFVGDAFLFRFAFEPGNTLLIDNPTGSISAVVVLRIQNEVAFAGQFPVGEVEAAGTATYWQTSETQFLLTAERQGDEKSHFVVEIPLYLLGRIELKAAPGSHSMISFRNGQPRDVEVRQSENEKLVAIGPIAPCDERLRK